MSFPSFSQLQWKPKPPSWSTNQSNPAWVGWDTETVQGNIGLICSDPQPIDQIEDKNKRKTLQRNYDGGLSPWKKWNPEDIVDTGEIIQHLFHPGYHGVWWNLAYDIECIIKHLPENQVKGLIYGQKVKLFDYLLHYIPGKKFTIRKGNRKSHHFDFASFYQSSLEDAAKRFLNDKKKKESFTRRELGESWDIWKDKKQEIIEYCKHDAYLTRKLAQLWYEWGQEFGVDVSFPISPANVAGRHALKKGIPEYPKFIHDTAGKAAWEAYYGGRFEFRKKGWFDQLYSIDIKSAYPSEMIRLPDASSGWDRTHKESKALQAVWGFVQCEIKVNREADWSPVMHRKADGLVFGPIGYLGKKWITLDEYKACKNHEHTSVTFKKAWIGEDSGNRPFEWLEDIYNKRTELKENNDPRELVLKIIMNSVYGKTLQKVPTNEAMKLEEHDGKPVRDANVVLVNGEPYRIKKNEYKIGPMFNPMYASTITARTRCQLWEVMQDYDTAIVMTDGVLTTEKPSKQLLGNKLGEWDYEGGGEGIIIGNGMYQIGDKRSKHRGFQLPQRFKDWIDAIKNLPDDATSITINQRRPLHPGEVIISRDHELTKIGAFTDMSKAIQFNNDRKRDFPDVTAKDLLTDNFEGEAITL